MNSVEQRRHKRVTDALAKSLEELAEATAGRFDAVDTRLAVLSAAIDQLQQLVGALASALTEEAATRARDELALTTELRREVRAFRDRTFVGRFTWLLIGR